MIVAGLDVDTHKAAYCVWNGREAIAYGTMTKREELRHFVNLKVDVVYVEETPFCKNAQTMRKLAQDVGVWLERIDNWGIRGLTLPVGKWKSLSLGIGNATKVQVKDIILATTNMPNGLPQDCYDACGLSLAGYALEKQADLVSRAG